MNISSLIGHTVTHISYGPGVIIDADDKLIWVQYESDKTKRFQFPQAFASYLMIDDDSMQEEILKMENERNFFFVKDPAGVSVQFM